VKIAVIIFLAVFAGKVSAEELFFIERGDTIFLKSETKSRADGWLVTQNGFRVKVAEGILVTLQNGASAENVFSTSAVKSYERLSGNIFLVIPADPSKQFELSRDFLKNASVKSSSPNLIRERRPR
jgi:hypothetical protein